MNLQYNLNSFDLCWPQLTFDINQKKRTLELTMGNPLAKYELCCTYIPNDPVFLQGFQDLTFVDLNWPWPVLKWSINLPYIYMISLDVGLLRYGSIDLCWPQITFDLHQNQQGFISNMRDPHANYEICCSTYLEIFY